MAGFSIGEALFDVGLDLSAFNAQLRHVQTAARRAGKKFNESFRPQKGTLTALDIKINSLEDEIRLVKIGTKRYKALAREIRVTTRARTTADKSIRGSGFLGGLASQAGGVLAGALGVGALVTGFKGAIDAAIEFDTVTKQLTATLGESGAARAINFTREMSNELGLSFTQTARDYGKFTAAATAANIPIEEQERLFKAVSNAGTKLGLTSDEVSGAFQALQQMASKGVVSMEELRQQLGERLPIAIAAAAKGFRVTPKEIIKMVEAGDLAAKDFFPKFTDGLNELTESAKGVQTVSSNFARLGNAWAELQVEFGANMLPTVIGHVQQLTKLLEGISIVMDANDIGMGGPLSWLGIIEERGPETVQTLRNIAKEFDLSREKVEALYKEVAKSAGFDDIRDVAVESRTSYEKFQEVLRNTKLEAKAVRAELDVNKETADAIAAAEQALNLAQRKADLEKGTELQKAQARLMQTQFDQASLDTRMKELGIAGQISNIRNQAAVTRNEAVQSLLQQEMNHSMKMAKDETTRGRIRQQYGQAIYDQTVREYQLKARGLAVEQQAQIRGLEIEHKKVVMANDRRILEAEIAAIQAKEALAKDDSEANLAKLKAAEDLVRLSKEQKRLTESLFNDELKLLGVKQASARDALTNQRLIELGSKKEFANNQQRARLQGEINRMIHNQGTETDQAAISAGNFRSQMEGASSAALSLPQKIETSVQTTIDSTSAFSNMNNHLANIEASTKNMAATPINIHISQNASGGYSARGSGGVAGTGL